MSTSAPDPVSVVVARNLLRHAQRYLTAFRTTTDPGHALTSAHRALAMIDNARDELDRQRAALVANLPRAETLM